MSKRLIIILSDKAEAYFNLVMYGLEVPDGKGSTKPPNQSQAISHCLEELALFEEFTEDQLTNWLLTNYPEKYKAYRDTLPDNMKEYANQANEYGATPGFIGVTLDIDVTGNLLAWKGWNQITDCKKRGYKTPDYTITSQDNIDTLLLSVKEEDRNTLYMRWSLNALINEQDLERSVATEAK
jgi:hypothetical protein